MTLTKDRLIESIVGDGTTKKEAAQIVETMLETIKSTLESGEDVMISGFGKFNIKDKRARRGRNPATGEEMDLGARRIVTFTCSKKLRNKVNNGE